LRYEYTIGFLHNGYANIAIKIEYPKNPHASHDEWGQWSLKVIIIKQRTNIHKNIGNTKKPPLARVAGEAGKNLFTYMC
jgi:hypothetical protein